MRFYLAYLLWAGKAIHQSGSDLMAEFASWFVETVSDDGIGTDFLQELKRYYATAFEFIAIGSAWLEREGSVVGCRRGKGIRCGL
jgi:hypothetical protein